MFSQAEVEAAQCTQSPRDYIHRHARRGMSVCRSVLEFRYIVRFPGLEDITITGKNPEAQAYRVLAALIWGVRWEGKAFDGS